MKGYGPDAVTREINDLRQRVKRLEADIVDLRKQTSTDFTIQQEVLDTRLASLEKVTSTRKKIGRK